MAIPDFDDAGNLPAGVHDATIDEVRQHLVETFEGSLTRRVIFEWWRQHRAALLEVVPVSEQWLGGSFASSKPDPNDMDLVIVLDGPTYDDLPRQRQLLLLPLVAGNYTEEIWQCDTYPVLSYPEGHPGRDAYLVAFERWQEHFGHDRQATARFRTGERRVDDDGRRHRPITP